MNKANVSIYEVQDELINENIKIVFPLIDKYQKENKIPCSCKDCMLDIAAITLNSLKPRYHVSLIGDFYQTIKSINEYKKKVEETLKKAIARVSERPHHEQ